ncbi:MAG: nitroreductase family protein [Marinifilaceae bacterium]
MNRILFTLLLILMSTTIKAQNMPFSQLVKHRQSVREYNSTPVEKEKLIQCLESARLSPSANNAQPWKFVVVNAPDVKNKLASAVAGMGMNKHAYKAPVIVAIVVEKRDMMSSVAGSAQDKDYSLLDIGIVANQFCLQATDIGLSTSIIGWFNEKEVKNVLNVPKDKRVPLIITVGYSDVPVREKKRKSIDEISSWNKY